MKKIIVHGRVQGVFFRDNTREKALELGITGTVRNLPDSTVEILAEGKKIDVFLAWLKKGPRLSRVDHIESEEINLAPIEGFKVIW